ncbi:MAG TPA: SDR family NAD(P)-dependent oxidoreductase [Mycobacteriales bacterium]|jgi:NAD(P)-dependent dehydrogenase (short-subunit alcohol dehydrogenase family)|nr:SDR family NAD(P)-dependent oxidoreductase [Mycobacteriales bacterium]
MDLGLVDKVAVVTGGSKGIGLAIARQLAAEGARVVLVSRTEADLAAAAASIEADTGRRPAIATADVGDDASVTALAERVAAEVGPVQVLVNAAATPNTAGGFPEDQLEDHINVKVRGALRTARAFAPGMIAAGWGRIVNISGLAARQSGSVVGSVRNVAVVAMSKTLADELGPQGVNVTVVHPGATATERTPALVARTAERQGTDAATAERSMARGVTIGRLVTAAEVADVVTFLASPRSVAINGDVIAAGGGVTGSVYY